MASTKEALERWRSHVEYVTAATHTAGRQESAEEREKRKERARRDYRYFVETYFPHYCSDKQSGKKTGSAKFHEWAAKKIKEDRQILAVFMWPRGHAKSTQMGVFIPMWLMIQREQTLHSMVLAGKSEDSATKLLSDLQAELEYNQLYERDWGRQYKAGSWSEGEFTTQGGVSFHAIGRGQSPRGLRDRSNRPDYILCDDLDDDDQSRNPARVAAAEEWTREALMGTMGAEGGRFIMVGNKISDNSVLAKMAESEGVYVSRVDAYDKNGKPAWPEYWTKERLEAMREKIGYRAFEKEYMNNPITIGAVFKKEDLVWGPMEKDLRRYRQLISYTDPSWKATTQNDYKATMLVGKSESGEYHVLKAYAGQTTVSEMIEWHYEIARYVRGRVPVYYYMEANLLQELIIEEFRKAGEARGDVIPVRGDSRKKVEKFARIEALQPLFEQRLVVFNAEERESAGMRVLEEQLLALQRGSRMHDDAPDALEGAIWLLNRRWSHGGGKIETVKRGVGRRKW